MPLIELVSGDVAYVVSSGGELIRARGEQDEHQTTRFFVAICAATLLTVMPSKAFAQTVSQAAPAVGEQKLAGAQAKPKHELKALFAEELAKHKADTVSAAERERLEKGWLDPQSTPKHSSGFSRRDAFLVVLLIVAITGLAIVLEHNGVETVTRCEDSPGTPDCVP